MARSAYILCLLLGCLLMPVGTLVQSAPVDLVRSSAPSLDETGPPDMPADQQGLLLALSGQAGELAEIQSLLNQLGYDAGPVDGRIGPKTLYAIRVFQSQVGLTVTGRADPELLKALRQMLAERQSQTAFPPSGPAATESGSTADFNILRDIDLPYSDYRTGMKEPGLRNIEFEECQRQCSLDGRCRSFTFNVRARVCFLKDKVPQRSAFKGAISGIKPTQLPASNLPSQAAAGSAPQGPQQPVAAASSGPQGPARARLAEANAQEAASICAYYRPGHVFHEVHDCTCIAEKVRQASMAGLLAKVTVTVVEDFGSSCPAGRERLFAYFEAQCLGNLGSYATKKTWALNGGCTCVANRSADSFAADPTRLPGGDLLACGYVEGTEKTGAAAAATVTKAEAALATQPGEGLRPFDIWLKDGRPVLFGDWRPLKTLDRTIDYEAQERALRRWIDLLMLADDPSLAEQQGALTVLAAENLEAAQYQQYLDRCEPEREDPTYCRWRAENEFEARRLQNAFAKAYLPRLIEIGRTMPREFTYVALTVLDVYDGQRGGFSARVVEESSWPSFSITDSSIFGFSGYVAGLRKAPERTLFWPVGASEAEAILTGLDGRYVQLAWSYRIEEVREPHDSNASREVLVTLVAAALYGDSRLTEKLYDLPVGNPAAQAAMPKGTPGKAAQAEAPAVVVRPPGLPTYGDLPVALIDPYRQDPEIRRYMELLAIGQHPELAKDPTHSLILARNFAAGFADPNGNEAWAGHNEFDKARNEAKFKADGAAAVIASAPLLPQTVLLVQPARLGAYDFDAQAFAITYDGGWQPGSGVKLGIANRSNDSLVGAIQLDLGSDQLPTAWNVPEGEAEQKLSYLVEGRRNFSSSVERLLYVASTVELTSVEIEASQRLVFTGRLLGAKLFADRELTQEIGPVLDLARSAKPGASDSPKPE